MAYTRQYTQGVGWQNEPSVNTPISAENLNQMDMAIQDVDEAVYNEFAAVYAAIAQAGGRNAVNFYIDSASNNTLSSQTSVLSDVTLKANDLIFLYMSVDGTYTSPTGGWGVTYSMYVDDTLTSFTATIVDYLHGEGAMWHEGFSANLVQGTWLILRVVSTTIFDCIGRIVPTPDSGGSMEEYATYVYDDEIVSERHNLILAKKAWGSTTPAENAILFLRIATNSDIVYGGAAMFGWVLKYVGSSAEYNVNSMLLDFRNGRSANVFKDTLQAGSILVLAYWPVGVHSCDDSWGVLAVIPAAGGGGGGTTVIANPSDPASSDLEKLQVGNTIYAINAGNSAEGNKITSTSRTDPDKLVTNIQLDSGIAEHEGDVFYLTSELNTGESQYGWNVQLQYAVGEGGYADIYIPLFGMNPSTVMDIFSGDIAAGDILVVKVTHSGIVQSYAMYILAYISASGGGASTLAGLTDTNIVSPSDKQYLKYNATSGKWENVSATKTFVKATPKMTGPTTPSGVVSASSEYNVNYSAWYAFDGVYGYDQQTWATAGGHTSGEWIQYLFGSAKVIKKIATVNRNESNVRAIKTFIFQASNDGTNFTDLGTFQISSSTAAYRQEFDINNDTAYLYYRLYVVSPWISGDLTVGLAELELFEEVEVEVAELDDLVDVDFVALADGQALVYDSASSKWVNNKAVGTAYGGTGNTDGYIRTGHKANTQIGTRATIEGQDNTATRENNHVEGYNNTTNNYDAHAEGRNNVVNGAAGHAEGESTQANANNAHSEGYGTTASGVNSHAQNNNTTASSANSSASGYYTTAGYENQFVVGKYNNNKSTSILEVGIGTGTNAKANGLELDTSGNLKTAGTITDGNGNVLGQPVAVDGVWVISGETATLTVTTP